MAVAIDGRYHGERQGASRTIDDVCQRHPRGLSVQTVAPVRVRPVWDVMRLIDYLRPEMMSTPPDRVNGESRAAWRRILAAAIETRIASRFR